MRLIYWLVERFASRTAAIVTALFFLAFQTADPSMLTAQHRWDSSAFALASIALCRRCAAWMADRRRFLIACATLATPSVALVGDRHVSLAAQAGRVVPARDRDSRQRPPSLRSGSMEYCRR